jgi:hypothetical protein
LTQKQTNFTKVKEKKKINQIQRNAVVATTKVNKTFVTYSDRGGDLRGAAVPPMVEGFS